MKIVFATNNAHKLSEVKAVLGDGFEIVTLKEVGITEDIPETGATLDENATIKADFARPSILMQSMPASVSSFKWSMVHISRELRIYVPFSSS